MTSEVKQYVLCFAQPRAFKWWPEVLLIQKRKPAWQAGKLNLPGGSIEPGETIHEAARRELLEETDIDCDLDEVSILGTLQGEGYIVYVTRCMFDSLRGRNVARSITSEPVMWMPVEEAFTDQRLINNLRTIIPLCRSNVSGWSFLEYSGQTAQLTQREDLCVPQSI